VTNLERLLVHRVRSYTDKLYTLLQSVYLSRLHLYTKLHFPSIRSFMAFLKAFRRHSQDRHDDWTNEQDHERESTISYYTLVSHEAHATPRILRNENRSGGLLVHVTDTVYRPNRGSGGCSHPGQASSTHHERSVIKISHIYIGVIGLSAARSAHHVYGRHNISSTRELNAGYNRVSHRRKCARRSRRISSL
jgi:hypothetical protein